MEPVSGGRDNIPTGDKGPKRDAVCAFTFRSFFSRKLEVAPPGSLEMQQR